MLAIVIPFFKINFFEETLDSLAAQTNKNFKVYIGDDNSPDNPYDLIDFYKTKLNINYKRFEKNLGGISLTKQWGRCIALAENEEWIMILGDDDILDFNVVDQFYKNLKEIDLHKIKVVRYASQEINDDSIVTSKEFYHPKIQDIEDFFINRFFNDVRSSLSEYIFSRSQYKIHGFRDIPLAWYADDLAWIDFTEFGRIYTINDAVVKFRLSKYNISRWDYLPAKKLELRYSYLKIILENYIKYFKIEHRKQILVEYERMTYSLKGSSLKFWYVFIPYIVRYRGILEAIKFSKRILEVK